MTTVIKFINDHKKEVEISVSIRATVKNITVKEGSKKLEQLNIDFEEDIVEELLSVLQSQDKKEGKKRDYNVARI